MGLGVALAGGHVSSSGLASVHHWSVLQFGFGFAGPVTLVNQYGSQQVLASNESCDLNPKWRGCQVMLLTPDGGVVHGNPPRNAQL
jgi:hypothetical protein